jgi:hypoxia up-regulated 1
LMPEDGGGIATEGVEGTVEGSVDDVSDGEEDTTGTATAATDTDSTTGEDNSDVDSEKEKSTASDTDVDAESTSSGDETEETKKTEEEEKEQKKKDKKEKKDKKKKEKKEKKVKVETQLKRTLIVEEDYTSTSPPAMSKTLISASKKKLTRLTAADAARKAKEAALNDLEAYACKIRNRLRDEDGPKQLGSVSTEEQREAIITSCNDIEEWLYDEGRHAELSEFKTKEIEIMTPAEVIFKRYKESVDRPKAVKKALKQLMNVTKKVDSWGEKLPHVTEEEKEGLRVLMTGELFYYIILCYV